MNSGWYKGSTVHVSLCTILQIANSISSVILQRQLIFKALLHREHFGDSLGGTGGVNNTEAMEERRQKLVYQLNSSGKYFAFKEQLKYAVVKIVREKYLKTTNFKDKDELQVQIMQLINLTSRKLHQFGGYHLLNSICRLSASLNILYIFLCRHSSVNYMYTLWTKCM